MIFFRNEITRIERSKNIVSVSEEDKEKSKATASALLFKSSKSPKCALCKKSYHTIDKCFNLTKINTQERYDLLKKISFVLNSYLKISITLEIAIMYVKFVIKLTIFCYVKLKGNLMVMLIIHLCLLLQITLVLKQMS